MAIADLTLNVSKQKYEARITTLEGYVSSLNDLLSQYQAKKNEVDSIWQDSEADSYKQTVQANIDKVQQAIDAANANITELRQVVNNMTATNTAVQGLVDEALNIAENLFS